MSHPDTLVSIGLPLRNAGESVRGVVESVLAQDHADIELVISDNASTDDSQDVCQALAEKDERIRYHRQAENIGLMNNFVFVLRAARGRYFRWIGDDDRLEATYVSRTAGVLAADPRLILVTSQTAYTGEDGQTSTAEYHGTALGSDDPVDRFVEMLKMLHEGHVLLDPLYGTFRRDAVVDIPRRNMLREDEVFATKLALAGPWAHLNEVLSHRYWKTENQTRIAHRLDVPAWQARLSHTLKFREILQWIDQADLTPQQRARARSAVHRMYLRRQQMVVLHRGRKLLRRVLGG
jgi:glycosyltransferase involved in cell wall biosynthesis